MTVCPVCGKRVAANDAGLLALHHVIVAERSGEWTSYRSEVCEGVSEGIRAATTTWAKGGAA